MKRLVVAGIVSIALATSLYAGEVVTLPKSIIISNPTTNQIDKHSIEFFYGPPAYAVVKYRPIDSDGRLPRKIISVKIENIADDPATTPANCASAGDPWAGCTGTGTGGEFLDPATEQPWDETSANFTNFVSGFGSTLKTRSDAAIYSDIQGRFDLQD